MDWKALLFSPGGRVNRARYWLTLIGAELVIGVLYIPIIATVDKGQQAMIPVQSAYAIFLGLLLLVLFYVSVILGIKRFHDRDKSGWWVLISLVPLIGGIWYFVEAGCLRGTRGSNRFGPDPLAPHEDIIGVFGTQERQAVR